jgi:hypothetical protein
MEIMHTQPTSRKVSSRRSSPAPRVETTSALVRRAQPQLKKLGASLIVAKKKAAVFIARNPLGAVVGASAFGFALAKLKRLV